MSLGMEGRHHRAWGLAGIRPAVDGLVDAPAIPARNTTARGSADRPGLYDESGHRLYQLVAALWTGSRAARSLSGPRPGRASVETPSEIQDLADSWPGGVKGPRAPGQRNKGKELSCSSH